LDLSITIAGTSYSPANPIPLSISGASFSGSGALIAGPSLTASMIAKGFFAGDAAARAGLGYHIGTSSSENVNGAIAYQKGPAL
jgi:hypothetical protein